MDDQEISRVSPSDSAARCVWLGNRHQSDARDTSYRHYPFNVIVKHPADGVPLTPHAAIRQGDYELIHDWSGRLLLYNIVQGPRLLKAQPGASVLRVSQRRGQIRLALRLADRRFHCVAT